MRARLDRLAVFALCALLASAGACLFAPQIDQYGYAACAADDDCAAGRACRAGLCTPPPWNDAAFATRQLLLIENVSDEEIDADAAVKVRIGAGGMLDTSAIGVDGRLSFYDWSNAAWLEVPAYRDVYGDHLDMWVRLSAPLAAGATAPLAWLDTTTGLDEPNLLEEPSQVFTFFDDFNVALLPPADWATYGTGDVSSTDGVVNVPDNAKLVSLTPLRAPLSLTFRARVNGVNCDQVYMGLLSDDGAGFTTPSVGFFVTGDLRTQLEVAPTDVSVPSQPAELSAFDLDTAEHTFTLDAGDGSVRFSLDGVTLGEPRLSPRFAGETLYFVIDVDGACSVDLERVYATGLPFDHPLLTALERVEFELVE